MSGVVVGAGQREPGARARAARRLSLCETLDRVLHKGAVVAGDLIISVAGVDLLYVGLNVVVASVDTIRAWQDASAAREVARG